MSTYKLDSLNELINAIDMGLDIEFFIGEIRYNISCRNNQPFICTCPDGEAVFFNNTQDLLDNYNIEDVPIRDLWEKIDIYTM